LRLRPKLEAAKLLAAKLEASDKMLEAVYRTLQASSFVVLDSYEHLVVSLKLGGQELGGFQLWP
jgi:hypothetical protein